MIIKRQRIGHICILEIDGRLDSINAPQFQNAIINAMDDKSIRSIILKMAGVDYLSAAGLRVLNVLKEQRGQVHLAAPSLRVREVLQITGLDIVYSMHPSPTEAIHHLNPVINAFTRLEDSWLADKVPPMEGQKMIAWQTNVERAERRLTADQRPAIIAQAITLGVGELAQIGTTVILDISKDGRSIQPLVRSDLRGAVFIEVAGLREEEVESRFAQVRSLIENYRPLMDPRLRIGMALGPLYGIHPQLLKKALAYARVESLPLCIPVARSEAETSFMLNGTGDIVENYFSEDRPAIPSPHMRPIAYLEELGALDLKPLLIHCAHINEDDIARIQRSGATIIHTPRSDLRLRCGRLPLEKLRTAEIGVLLGTASLASTPDLNIFNEAEIAIALHQGYVNPEEILNMVYQPLPF